MAHCISFASEKRSESQQNFAPQSYPTSAEAIRRLGDAYNRTRLTPFVAKLFKKWLAWTR